MEPTTNANRDKLIEQVMAANTLEAIRQARQDVETWRKSHPEDTNLNALEEQLARMQSALGEQSPGSYEYLEQSAQ